MNLRVACLVIWVVALSLSLVTLIMKVQNGVQLGLGDFTTTLLSVGLIAAKWTYIGAAASRGDQAPPSVPK